MRVVIDTNVLMSAFISLKSAPAQILAHFEMGSFQWIISEEILHEYHNALHYPRVMQRHKLSSAQVVQFLDDLRGVAMLVKPTLSLWGVATDPNDEKFFECALPASAHFLVSSDQAVQAVKQFHDIQIVSPALFVALLNQSKKDFYS